jgi:hypothetical protein
VAVSSYLSDVAGGPVVAASFADESAAGAALDLLRSSGVRWQDLSVVARDASRALNVAQQRAWSPFRGDGRSSLARLLSGMRLPADLRRRFGDAMRSGRIVVVAAADGQPPDTLAALLTQAGASDVRQWWQPPTALFAPPELAGPF